MRAKKVDTLRAALFHLGMNRAFVLVVRALLLTTTTALAESAMAANQVVGNCSNDTELRADLIAIQNSGGGTLTFSCSTSTISLTSVLPVILTSTKIDGDHKITLSGGNGSRAFLVEPAGSLELEDIVITNASASGDGGAIYSNGPLTLRGVTIQNSGASLSGGAIVTYGPLLIEDSTLAFNRAQNAGAVYARFAAAGVTIRDSVLHHNDTTLNNLTGLGGAILLWDGANLAIDGSHFHDNRAVRGGAVSNPFSNSSVTIHDSLFERNRAGLDDLTADDVYGGAVHSVGGVLAIDTTVMLENEARHFGGAVFAEGGVVSIDDCLIRDGKSQQGAGMTCIGCQLAVRRTTFRGNEGSSSAGALVAQGVNTFENVTFAENTATMSGAALYNEGLTLLQNTTVHANTGPNVLFASESTLSLRNTIVSGSSGANCEIALGTFSSLDGNLSDDTSCSAALNKVNDRNGSQYDPLLVLSEIFHASEVAYIPQPGSPAVDGGVPLDAPEIDQRRVNRPQGIAVDKGSVEVAACGTVVCGDATGDGSVAAGDALLALRTAVGSGACPLWRCDFNGDESIAASDALAILRKAVGQTPSPNCPDPWDCVD